MTTPATDLLRYDPRAAFLPKTGLSQAEFDGLSAKLEAARTEVLKADLDLYHAQTGIPTEKQPLDAGFYEMPARILQAYRKEGEKSELGRILKRANELAAQVDKVVVLGIGGSYMGAKALMDACCEPYFNELSRGERGGRPRIYFEGNNVDNDASQGLLKLLGAGKPFTGVEDRWGIVVISKSGGTLETAAAFRQFFAALTQSCGGDAKAAAKLVVPVTGKTGRLFDLATALGCEEKFEVPDGVGGRFSILSAVGLMPAALLGIDVVKLLEGAAAMNDHFATAPIAKNAVLDYVGVSHLLEENHGVTIRCLSVWSKALESAGLWYDQLLAESLGKHERGATPFTAVNTRDLHSRAQQHQEGRRDKLMTNVIVDHWRSDPLPVGKSQFDQDKLNDIADKTLVEIMAAAIAGTNEAYLGDGRPTADIHLPTISAHAMGQFFQMLMIATVVEGRLMGINPYGQPGVELYKKNMNRILGR
ncbi:MAG TPA: glucose-6-phosphate isomerase [Pirellulaceae bacterium]|nr:glucose-6-phosphate isomerase [Pirellulaceae bacterium]